MKRGTNNNTPQSGVKTSEAKTRSASVRKGAAEKPTPAKQIVSSDLKIETDSPRNEAPIVASPKRGSAQMVGAGLPPAPMPSAAVTGGGGGGGGGGPNVKVVCRFRPFNSKELAMPNLSCPAEFNKDGSGLTLRLQESLHKKDDQGAHKFNFDRVFDTNCTQPQIYEAAGRPIIESVLEGFNGTIFAYGQTSSGKTHTMQGPDIENLEQQGIIPRMVRTVFDRIDASSENLEFTVKVSMVEIYMERIKDLLDVNKDNLKVHEDKTRGVYIGDVTESYVAEEFEVYEIMRIGNNNRAISATEMNAQSSRSHSIFIMTITMNNLEDFSCKTGKLYLVDLAGSEKISKTGAKGTTLDEAKTINKSLTSLGMVINALTDGKSTHVPYRDSKLTRILSESLGGNAKTCLIITCSPSIFNEQETLSTLRFGMRAKSIKNKPKINKELTVAELKIMLARAEKDIELKTKRVAALEKVIRDLGGLVPLEDVETPNQIKLTEEFSGETPNNVESESDEELTETSTNLDEEEKKEMKSENQSMEKVDEESEEDETPSHFREEIIREEIYKVQAEKQKEIDALMEQLMQERQSAKLFNEKVVLLRKEYTTKVSRLQSLEKENDTMLNKMANLTIQMQELQHNSQEKDEKIRSLEVINHSFTDNIKLLKDEIEKINMVLDQKNLEIIELKGQIPSPDAILKGKLSLDEEEKLLHELDVMKQSHSKNQQKFKIIKELHGIDQRVVKILNEEDITDISNKVAMQNTLAAVALQHELEREKEKNKDLFEKLTKSNKNTTDLIKKAVEETVMKERKVYEEEKMYILKDLQNRVDKVVTLEMELDEANEKYKRLEASMSEGDKSMRRKVNSLEKNLEQLTLMYHQLASQKSVLKVDNQVFEKKLQRKTEKITNLERQLAQARDQVNQFKMQTEQLKGALGKYTNVETLMTSTDFEGFTARPKFNLNTSHNAKIRRPMRGGGKRTHTPRGMSFNQSMLHQTFQNMKEEEEENKPL